jgi:hypothetical protein
MNGMKKTIMLVYILYGKRIGEGEGGKWGRREKVKEKEKGVLVIILHSL